MAYFYSMEIVKTNILLILSFVLINTQLHATHNRAGEISYQQFSDTQIEARIVTYTKTSSIPADRDSLELCWGDGNCNFLLRINGPDTDGDGIPNGEQLPNNYKRNVYIGIHDYATAGDYILSMLDPNRNDGILNINFPNSGNVAFYIETTAKLFPSNVAPPNSSPILLVPPIDIAYVGATFQHLVNAYDPDGDSIAYELTTPLSDAGTPVPNYQSPSDIVPGGNNAISFSEVSGWLKWNAPQQAGEYNIAILIKTYRDGQEIDRTIRDMQILVQSPVNNPPELVFDTSIDENIVHLVSPGDTVRLELSTSDNDAGQQVEMTAYSGLLGYVPESASFTYDANNNKGYFEWIVDAAHIREQPYQISFKSLDDYIEGGLSTFRTLFYRVQTVSTNIQQTSGGYMRLYPNPIRKGQTLRIYAYYYPALFTYDIVNAEGKIVRSGELPDDSAISIHNLPAGVYYFVALKKMDITTSVQKFIIVE